MITTYYKLPVHAQKNILIGGDGLYQINFEPFYYNLSVQPNNV